VITAMLPKRMVDTIIANVSACCRRLERGPLRLPGSKPALGGAVSWIPLRHHDVSITFL
jgi:hypothetical protein